VQLSPVSYWNIVDFEFAEGQVGTCACLVLACVFSWDKLICSLRWAWNLGFICTRCLTLYKQFLALDLTLNCTVSFLKYVNESGNNECLVHVLWNLNTYLELYPNTEPYFWPWSYFLCQDHSFPKVIISCDLLGTTSCGAYTREFTEWVTHRMCFSGFPRHLNYSERCLTFCIFHKQNSGCVLPIPWMAIETRGEFWFGPGAPRVFSGHQVWVWAFNQTRDRYEGKEVVFDWTYQSLTSELKGYCWIVATYCFSIFPYVILAWGHLRAVQVMTSASILNKLGSGSDGRFLVVVGLSFGN